MSVLVPKHILRHILPLTILVFVLVAFLGAGQVGMVRDATGQMTGCPVMGVVAFCEMSPLAHMAKWQSLFSALPEREAAALLAVALFGLSMIFLLWQVRSARALSTVPSFGLRSKAAPVPIQSALQEAFSNGILNPKIF